MPKTLSYVLADLADIQAVYHDLLIYSITNDSREVTPGALFLAFSGAQTDGRQYIMQAIKKGAVAVCIDAEERLQSAPKNMPCILVPNLKSKQAAIATRFYDNPSEKLSIIGVTGTNGKTSVTQFIAQLSEKKCAVIGTTGFGFLPDLTASKNTTPDPLRLQRMIADCVNQNAKMLAMEVSSHGLAEKRMENVRFDTAVFTNLTQDHLDFHGTMENYRNAKWQLFCQPNLKNAVINIDDETGDYFTKKIVDRLNVITYSANGNKNADIIASNFMPNASGFSATITTPWGDGNIQTNLIGQFNLSNILAAIGVLGLIGQPLSSTLQRVSQLTPVPGRMMVYHQDNYPTVVIDYAHTPDALANALQALKKHCAGQLWCVFGCGGDRDTSKRAQMGAIAQQLSDAIIITNDNPRSESPEYIANAILSGIENQDKVTVILDRAKAIDEAMQKALPGDVVLLAGKGHESTQTIGGKVLPFSDVQQVLSIVEQKNK